MYTNNRKTCIYECRQHLALFRGVTVANEYLFFYSRSHTIFEMVSRWKAYEHNNVYFKIIISFELTNMNLWFIFDG